MPSRKKREPEPIPSEEIVIERNPVYQVTQKRYVGEEARKMHAEDARRRRRLARLEKARHDGISERNQCVLGFFRMVLYEELVANPGGLRFEEDWEPEIHAGLAKIGAMPALEAFEMGMHFGRLLQTLDEKAGTFASDGNHKPTAGKMKGAFPLFVLQLAQLKVPLEPEVIEAFFGQAEEGLALPGRDLTQAHHGALGLLARANAATSRPLATNDQTLGLDETGPKPVIRYRIEGDSKPRTCTRHNLKTRVIPAVQKALTHK